MSRPLRWTICAAAALVLCCAGGLALGGGFLVNSGSAAQAASCGGAAPATPATGDLPSVDGLSADQMRNAATIIAVGQQMNVPPRGWVIAVATALQESDLINTPGGDQDSVGLFQQRPSQGWGTPAQLMDPAYASRKFYEKLLTINGWESMALTDAAQAVQRSAYPDAYAKHEPLATAIVNKLADGAGSAAGTMVGQCAPAGAIAASGWTVPVRGPIVSGFRTPERPTHDGVDIAVPKNTPIHAAAAGIVLVARCNASLDGQPYSCDVDGSPAVKGCGWYVDILHAGDFVTRYCHQIRQPSVTPGQHVTAGQVIGSSGTSGNSSGPHVHFETHVNGDRSSNGAVDPVPFMQQRGAPLGQP